VVAIPVAVAWIQTNTWGLPTIAPVASVNPNNLVSPYGFPVWVRYCHFFNFLFARAWHFINIHGFIVTGIVFALVATFQWKRIAPTWFDTACAPPLRG
jgi:hypothetical protein